MAAIGNKYDTNFLGEMIVLSAKTRRVIAQIIRQKIISIIIPSIMVESVLLKSFNSKYALQQVMHSSVNRYASRVIFILLA